MSHVARLRSVLVALAVVVVLAGCGGAPSAPPPSPPPVSPEVSEAASTPGSGNGNGADYPDPLPLTGDIDGVHDPSMVRAADGSYLLYSTGDNLTIRTSKDRTKWSRAGSVWPKGAPWTKPFTSPVDRGALWAPDVSFHSGTFYLYYAASSFGSRNSAIFLATSRTGLAGSWKDGGLVLRTTSSSDYNAIDPNLVVDDGGWWLSFGSFWSGLKLVELDAATGMPVAKHPRYYNLATRPLDVGGAVEAPYIVRHGGYYYLFAAFDLCCRGTSSTYRTMVGRSKKVTGPYLDHDAVPLTEGGGTEVLATHGAIVGPGHPAVLHDGARDYLVYHYYTDDGAPGASRLGVNPITWVNGWPVAA